MENNSGVSIKLPQYQSHKVVGALKIKNFVWKDEAGNLLLEFENERYAPLALNANGKPAPQIGGYYVVYEDGYESFSPAKAFEEGYTLIS